MKKLKKAELELRAEERALTRREQEAADALSRAVRAEAESYKRMKAEEITEAEQMEDLIHAEKKTAVRTYRRNLRATRREVRSEAGALRKMLRA